MTHYRTNSVFVRIWPTNAPTIRKWTDVPNNGLTIRAPSYWEAGWMTQRICGHSTTLWVGTLSLFEVKITNIPSVFVFKYFRIWSGVWKWRRVSQQSPSHVSLQNGLYLWVRPIDWIEGSICSGGPVWCVFVHHHGADQTCLFRGSCHEQCSIFCWIFGDYCVFCGGDSADDWILCCVGNQNQKLGEGEHDAAIPFMQILLDLQLCRMQSVLGICSEENIQKVGWRRSGGWPRRHWRLMIRWYGLYIGTMMDWICILNFLAHLFFQTTFCVQGWRRLQLWPSLNMDCKLGFTTLSMNGFIFWSIIWYCKSDCPKHVSQRKKWEKNVRFERIQTSFSVKIRLQ